MIDYELAASDAALIIMGLAHRVEGDEMRNESSERAGANAMRRPNDFYPTPAWATHELLKLFDPGPAPLELCSGDNAISTVLFRAQGRVYSNDIDETRPAAYHYDARQFPYERGELFPRPISSVVTNPPFSCAFPIVARAVATGMPCAFLLRLSFLEPTFDRGPWLAEHPPSGVLVLPRISFTGDGKTDSVTCGWLLFNAEPIGVRVVSKGARPELREAVG